MNGYTRQITKNIIYILRQLQYANSSKNNQTSSSNNEQIQQLRDLYIYIGILVFIIISILGGYALYKKCAEKKILQEIEREYQIMIMNLLNNNSSISSSQEDKRPHSCNNINQAQLQSINELDNPDVYNSLENNHEERIENIRKKFGNQLVIKCLLKKYIEDIKYTKKFGEEYGDICTICMESFIENVLISKTSCEHIFHKKCFDTYLKEIEKKDKLLCPNCNQNLLINKKFLKLRVKNKKNEIKKILNNKGIKESELNLDNDFKNRMSVATNKNEENISSNTNNEIIYLKKKAKKENNNNIIENKINALKNDNNNIYNPLQIRVKKISESKNDKETILPYISKNENKEDYKTAKRNIVIINHHEKKNNTLKKSLDSKESNQKLYNNRKVNVSINSERDKIMFSKNTCAPFMSTSKQDNV